MNFFHRLLNPHCFECRDESICNTCEVLKLEIERLRLENGKLLDRILEKPNDERYIQRNKEENLVAPARNIPWTVRRQMLEREDREKAKLMNDAPKPNTSIEDLEKELGVAKKD